MTKFGKCSRCGKTLVDDPREDSSRGMALYEIEFDQDGYSFEKPWRLCARCNIELNEWVLKRNPTDEEEDL